MSERSAGDLAIVLHCHMPYVEGFGTYPFGEEWLFDAVIRSYLPVLEVADAADDDGDAGAGRPARGRRRAGAAAGVPGRVADRRRRGRPGEVRPSAAPPAKPSWPATGGRWSCSTRPAATRCCRSSGRREQGRVALAASAATHAVLPLLATRAGVRLQLDAGIRSHRRRFGWDGGFWLPECAYAPGLEWRLAEAGVSWFCVDQSAHEEPLAGAGADPHRGRPGGAADRLGGDRLALVARRLPLRPRPRPVRRQIAARGAALEGRRRGLRPGRRGGRGAAPGGRSSSPPPPPACASYAAGAAAAAACSSSRSTPSCSATGGRRARSGCGRCWRAPRRRACGPSTVPQALAEHEPVERALRRVHLGRGEGPRTWDSPPVADLAWGGAAAGAAAAAGALGGPAPATPRCAPPASCWRRRQATGPSSTSAARRATTPSSAPPTTPGRCWRP